MTTNVIITFKSTPEKLAAFTNILKQVKNDLPNVEGCKAVRIFNDVNEPCIFTLVETWVSEIEHKKHIESVVSSGGWAHIASHLACDPTSSYYMEL